MELILDASSKVTRAGVASQGLLMWTSEPLPPKEHTRRLLPAIVTGLHATSSTFDDVVLIVVALGPGPFNGLRVALSSAKGFAAARGAAIVGISTLEAEAYRCPPAIGTVRPILSAGRTGFATALFAWQDGVWTPTEDARHVDAAEATRFLEEHVYLCGEIDALMELAPASVAPTRCFAAAREPRLEVLAALGWQRYSAGCTSSAAALQPEYARPPHITTPRERRP
ncbi:MAG: tRNA (adenosine(37)-N6)-threonylcarbamoyltransferase complex dimerization subunit type 1 TsaB [Dehalococcoidia bacterium]|nr:MAG: tRNA (adenosine(37)-N6)-threonylcarbamoyltransferase complex dimerization subunit type 1 TsaB [Dehalococcoidia bacterium]